MKRASQIEIGSAKLALPCLFPSVSSVRTNLPPWAYIDLLVSLQFPQFLLSAYDFSRGDADSRKAMLNAVVEARKAGRAILLDSGNYESYWHRDLTWTPEEFHRACAELGPTMAFSFDGPVEELSGSVEKVLRSLANDQEAVESVPVVPIVHGKTPDQLPSLVAEVAKSAAIPMIAVAERELGDGLRHRMRTVADIRRALDKNPGFYRALHVLGTGNPFSIVALTKSGADSFDGLEWCQTTVDFETGQLGHFQHWDLFAATSPVCKLTDFPEVPYQQRVLAHNLVFCAEFLSSLRQYVVSETATGVIDRILQKLRPVMEEGRR